MKHIPNFQIDLEHKCETCVEAKLTMSSFQIIKRNIMIYVILNPFKQEVVINILLPLLMIAQNIAMYIC